LIDCRGIVPSSASHDTSTETVLKGVVRIEALATPSDHIAALLQRVKPIYLSRTYGIPLPEPEKNEEAEAGDDTTKKQLKTWDPEDFLDKLARMKGRLLKGGEPDLEGVAKIVLTDWVRGRIPFYVMPPEREGRSEVKDKGKEKESAEPVIGVSQKLGGIMHKTKFVGDDVKDDEMVDADGEQEGDGGEDDADEGEEESGDGEEEELTWNDVFAGDADEAHVIVPAEQDASSDDGSDDEEALGAEKRAAPESDGEDEDDDPKPRKKEPRMTTNKKKAANFFTNANVKNRRRSKPKLPSTQSPRRNIKDRRRNGGR